MCFSRSTWLGTVLALFLLASFLCKEVSVCHVNIGSSQKKVPTSMADYTGTAKCNYEFAYGMIKISYDGRLHQGQMSGKGIYSDNGEVYEGYFANNERHGPGAMTMQDGTVIKGDWAHQLPHGGDTSITLPTESGVWYDTLKETGMGGGQMSGEFKHGNMQGVGVMAFPDGTAYKGMWNESAFTGPGSLELPTGQEYAVYGTFYPDTGAWTGIAGTIDKMEEYNLNCTMSYLGVHCLSSEGKKGEVAKQGKESAEKSEKEEEEEVRVCGTVCQSVNLAIERALRLQARIWMDVKVRLRGRMYEWARATLERAIPVSGKGSKAKTDL